MNFSDVMNMASAMFCSWIRPATGAPGRIGLLEELLDYIETFDGVWWTTGEKMYEYCLKSSQDR